MLLPIFVLSVYFPFEMVSFELVGRCSKLDGLLMGSLVGLEEGMRRGKLFALRGPPMSFCAVDGLLS